MTTRKPATVPGLRSTRQRTAVAEVLDDLDAFRSAQQIHAELTARGESVGLTTVRQPVREIGRLGARLMLDGLEGFGTIAHHPVELTLVERATSGPPSTSR